MEIRQITYCDFMIRGMDLASMDFNGKSDPYVVIKVPTRILSKRNIFEYELDDLRASTGSNGSLGSSSSFTPRPSGSDNSLGGSATLRNSQGIVCYEDSRHDVEEHTNILSNLASSSVHNHSAYFYHKKAHPNTEGYREVFESEVVKANLNPQWQPFRIGFYELCKGNPTVELLVECYDWDRFKPSDFIGSCKITVASLLEKKDVELQLVNKQNIKSGRLGVRCAPAITDVVYCDFKASATGLPKKKLGGNKDPYFVIKTPLNITEQKNLYTYSYDSDIVPPTSKLKCGSQIHPSTEGYREIYESPVIKHTQNPDWGIFQLGFYDMCRGNPDVKLLIECYYSNGIISNNFIGSAEISVQFILNTIGNFSLPLLSKKDGSVKGNISLHCKPSNSSTRFRKVSH